MDTNLPNDACTFVARAKESILRFKETDALDLDFSYLKEAVLFLDSAIEKLTNK